MLPENLDKRLLTRASLICILLLAGSILNGEIIDRVAVTIGTRVLTESMVMQQLRMSAFYDDQEPAITGLSKRRAADVLVAQVLLIQQMDDTRFTTPSMSDVKEHLKEIVGPRYPNDAAYQADLVRRGLSDEDVLQFLQQMIRAEQFTELRFRRGQQVSTDEIALYYGREYRSIWTKQNPGKPYPPLEELSEDIEELLLTSKTDIATDEWVKETKESAKVRFREEVFQ